jgi:hypothetical protein
MKHTLTGHLGVIFILARGERPFVLFSRIIADRRRIIIACFMLVIHSGTGRDRREFELL